MPTISAVKTNDREFDDSNVCGSMKDNVAELDTQVVIADGLFFGDIFWMTSASFAAIIWICCVGSSGGSRGLPGWSF